MIKTICDGCEKNLTDEFHWLVNAAYFNNMPAHDLGVPYKQRNYCQDCISFKTINKK